MFSRDKNEMNGWTVGRAGVGGFPVPAVGLVHPQSLGDKRLLLIRESTILRLRPSEITSRHYSFADFYRANAYSDLGKTVLAELQEGPVDLFLFLAAADYCGGAKLTRQEDIQRETRIVLEGYLISQFSLSLQLLHPQQRNCSTFS